MQIVVDGLLTHYQILGEKNKPVFLILHGWKRSLAEWLLVAKQLTDTYQVVLLDLPGFGQTVKPESDYTIYDYATFVEHFLDKLHVKKVTFLGHSFGGRIGIILGATTQRLGKLILVDAAGVEQRSLVAKIKIFVFKTIKIFLPNKLVEKLRHILGSLDYKTSGELRQIFIRVINEDLTYLLGKVYVPAVIIWGNYDREVPQWKIKRMKDMIPQSVLRVVWGSGHDPHLEKPREFMEILKEYV